MMIILMLIVYNAQLVVKNVVLLLIVVVVMINIILTDNLAFNVLINMLNVVIVQQLFNVKVQIDPQTIQPIACVILDILMMDLIKQIVINVHLLVNYVKITLINVYHV